MPYCEVVDLPGGGTAIIRMSGKRPQPCEVCGLRRHTALCDALVGRKTCDRKLCAQCSTPGRGSKKLDYCPEHKEFA